MSLLSVLISCPLHFLGIIVSLTVGGFMVGLSLAGVGCILGGGIGLILGVALFLYAPAFVTIPYCFKNLLK